MARPPVFPADCGNAAMPTLFEVADDRLAVALPRVLSGATISIGATLLLDRLGTSSYSSRKGVAPTDYRIFKVGQSTLPRLGKLGKTPSAAGPSTVL